MARKSLDYSRVLILIKSRIIIMQLDDYIPHLGNPIISALAMVILVTVLKVNRKMTYS